MNIYNASIENKINIKDLSIGANISSKKYYPSYSRFDTLIDLNNVFLDIKLGNISNKKYIPSFNLLYSFSQKKIVRVLRVKT